MMDFVSSSAAFIAKALGVQCAFDERSFRGCLDHVSIELFWRNLGSFLNIYNSFGGICPLHMV